jgi:hypothetical protein
VVHGHDQEDYENALNDSTFEVGDSVELAELRVANLGLKPFSWSDVLKWNHLALKTLINDYFPLLRLDDMPEYGDRVCPAHMLDLLIQRDRIAFSECPPTEEEFDAINEFRKVVAEVLDYTMRDLIERRGDLATKLVRNNDLPVHDTDYVWGKTYEKEQLTAIESFVGSPQDWIVSRAPRRGDTVAVIRNNVYAIHPETKEALKPGDRVVVNSVNGTYQRIYYLADGVLWYIPVKDVSGIGFKISAIKNESSKAAGVVEVEKSPSKSWNLNIYADCVALEPVYADRQCRVNPRHVADVVALRFFDLITSQQSKVLLERVWDNFGWYDVFHHARELGLMEEVDGDLTEIIKRVLNESEQAVKDYKCGKKAAFGRIMGNAMKACMGKGRPNQIREALERMLG